MAIRFTIQAGTGLASPEAANVVLRAGVCSGGTSNARYEIDPGQDPTPSIGYGPLAEAAVQASRLSGARQILLKVPATTAGTISSVTKSPANTSPLITVAGSLLDGITTPFDAFDVRVRVSEQGLPGAGRVDVALDGGSFNYTFDVPAQAKATIDGDVDLTGLTLASLNGLTLILTPDGGGGPQTITFTAPANVADIAVQANTQTTLMTFSIIQGKYLRIESDTEGPTSSLSIDTASTADMVLGVSGTAAGAASTISLPGTGLVLTFPATSAYELDTTFSFTTTAPRHSQADLDTALDAANADTSLAWGLVEVVQEPVDGPDTLAYAADLDAIVAAWEAQEDKRFTPWLLGAPVSIADTALKSAMTGHTSRYGTVAAGDVYTTASTPSPKGIMRRSFRRPLAIRLAARSEDVV